jgi:hypothetical protein
MLLIGCHAHEEKKAHPDADGLVSSASFVSAYAKIPVSASA